MSRFQEPFYMALVVLTLVHGTLAYYTQFPLPPSNLQPVTNCISPCMMSMDDQEGIEETENQKILPARTAPFLNLFNGLLNNGPNYFGPCPPNLGYPPPCPHQWSPCPCGLLGPFGYRLPPPMRFNVAQDKDDSKECAYASRSSPLYELFVENSAGGEAEPNDKRSQSCSKYKPSKNAETRTKKRIKIVD